MYDLKLFLGIAADVELEKALSKINPHLLSLYMSGGNYLSAVSLKEQRYFGKPAPLSSSVNQLENLETHLLSLLRKLVPEYPLSKPVLVTHIDDHQR